MDEKEQVLASIRLIAAVGDAIRLMSPVPKGVVYAAVMPVFTHHTFERIIESLKKAQLITEKNNVLRWVGDEAATEKFTKTKEAAGGSK